MHNTDRPGADFEASPMLTPEAHASAPVFKRSANQRPSWLHIALPAREDWEAEQTTSQPQHSTEVIVVVAKRKHRAAIVLTENFLRLLCEVSRYGGSPAVNPNSATKATKRDYLRFKTPDDLFTAARLITGAGEHEAVEQLRETSMLDLRPSALRIKGDGKPQKSAWPPVLRAAIRGAELRASQTPNGLLPCGATVEEYRENLERLHEAVLVEYRSYHADGGEVGA